jgi:protein-S-isoprenylcysteine O-methyltransferase Ste14
MQARLFVIVRAAFFSALFIALFIWFVPRWMARAPLVPQWNAVSVALMAIGGAIMLRCIWDFAWTGRGTPAPFDPPRRLVIAGLYRYVRNPMYVGMAVFLVGEALLLPAITRSMLLLIAVMWGVLTAFILGYEEPTLRRLFGDDYEHYTRHVRRWLPRLTPFDKLQARA